jgi:hypothetical protein
MAESMISGFPFVCRYCNEPFEVHYKHAANILPKFTTVECPKCGMANNDPGSPDPIWTRPAEPD